MNVLRTAVLTHTAGADSARAGRHLARLGFPPVYVVNTDTQADALSAFRFLSQDTDVVVVVEPDMPLRLALNAGAEDAGATVGRTQVVFWHAADIPLFEKTAKTVFHRGKPQIGVYVLKTFNVTVEEIQELLKNLTFRKMQVEFKPSLLECDVQLKYPLSTPEADLKAAVDKLTRALSAHVYGVGSVTLAEAASALLHEKGKKVAFCESFTGGGLAAEMVAVPGASDVLISSVVAYTDAAKVGYLGVPEKTIAQFTAVSKEVAFEMCLAALESTGADIAVATTGFAGPAGGRVGECYIALGGAGNKDNRDSIHLYKFKFAGTREDITKMGIKHALHLLYKQVKAIK
ncbi:MAG: nicotinamide-nucleotide amidohydrolase family protein [Clostridiales bacterium]|jgi:PncC family amidohydrolase|nr:nicotinamide-nucleotide amidohydrolase family protein [Clostridiales bacterium]